MLRRLLLSLFYVVYGAAILLACDFAYSNLFAPEPRPLRVSSEIFDHGLAPNYDGPDVWADRFYDVRTNNLGFKDARVREVPLRSPTRRVLLIGDSFAEGIGLPFEQTFAGMLYRAGLDGADKVEFLNAGAASYSPVIYYRKVKYLLEQGLTFDEVVVFPDLSDIADEATSYFCIDEHPEYRAHCNAATAPKFADAGRRKNFLQRHFTVIDASIALARVKLEALRAGHDSARTLDTMINNPAARWPVPGTDVGPLFAPLGLDGGIARAQSNMAALADLLASRNIALSVVVYPWAAQLALDDRDSRAIAIWRDFCKGRCKDFIDTFPAFFEQKDAHADWYDKLFLTGDFHYSANGNRVLYRALAPHLVPAAP
jgi:hypothetical protein